MMKYLLLLFLFSTSVYADDIFISSFRTDQTEDTITVHARCSTRVSQPCIVTMEWVIPGQLDDKSCPEHYYVYPFGNDVERPFTFTITSPELVLLCCITLSTEDGEILHGQFLMVMRHHII